MVSHVSMSTENRQRLRAIFHAFDLSAASVADITGFSRPYVARLLSEQDDLSGSPEFWRVLEERLGRVIDARRGQVFDVAAMPAERVDVLKTIG